MDSCLKRVGISFIGIVKECCSGMKEKERRDRQLKLGEAAVISSGWQLLAGKERRVFLLKCFRKYKEGPVYCSTTMAGTT